MGIILPSSASSGSDNVLILGIYLHYFVQWIPFTHITFPSRMELEDTTLPNPPPALTENQLSHQLSPARTPFPPGWENGYIGGCV